MNLGELDLRKLFRQVENINFTEIVIVAVSAWVLILVSQRAITWVARRLPSRFRLWLLPMVPVTRVVTVVVAVIWILTSILKPDPKGLLTLSAAAALGLGFAFKDYVSSLIAGLVLIYERPCSPGDWVEIDGVYGEITFLGWRSMTLVTPDDTTVTVPNLKLWTSMILNSNAGATTQQCVADIYVHPRHDGRTALAKLEDVAMTSPFLRFDQPVVVVAKEELWATHYRIRAYPTDMRDQFHFVTDLVARSKRALEEAGIELAVPEAVRVARSRTKPSRASKKDGVP